MKQICLLFVTLCFCFQSNDVFAQTEPPSGDKHGFGNSYKETSDIATVYVKIGKVSFWYETGGNPDAPRAAPGYVRVSDEDTNRSIVDGVVISCDGKTVFESRQTYLTLPVGLIRKMIVAKQVEVILEIGKQTKREILTPEDKANLLKLLESGANWKAPDDLLGRHGQLTFVVVAGPEMHKRWDVVSSRLKRAVERRTEKNDLTMLAFLDNAPRFIPSRRHISASGQNMKRIQDALEKLPKGPEAFALDRKIGDALVDDAHWSWARTLVLLVAEPIPEECIDGMIEEAQRKNIRFDVVWCGLEKPDDKTKTVLSRLTTETVGVWGDLGLETSTTRVNH